MNRDGARRDTEPPQAELIKDLLHTLPVRPQSHYNVIQRRGPSWTTARSLKSTPIQHQPNVSEVADAPDSKSGVLMLVSFQVQSRNSQRCSLYANRVPFGELVRSANARARSAQ